MEGGHHGVGQFLLAALAGAVLRTPEPVAAIRGAGGFRPTSTVTHTYTGTRVNEGRMPRTNAPAAIFDLRIETDGEMHYVDNSKVDHLRFVTYSVTHLLRETEEEMVTPVQTGAL